MSTNVKAPADKRCQVSKVGYYRILNNILVFENSHVIAPSRNRTSEVVEVEKIDIDLPSILANFQHQIGYGQIEVTLSWQVVEWMRHLLGWTGAIMRKVIGPGVMRLGWRTHEASNVVLLSLDGVQSQNQLNA